ncbi:aminoacyl-tRNA hydrolase [Candidatus Daviesbacteria bacterium RIFCSPLOWO2_01_FULL_39_12]|uniref:Peptidyl-tRNA hydrolase n=1 Tax=Candidatus Daviesbacteria bacterium RIFCSPLOWO2_01_FULL_39_12 TaxID=1797785 RepID=A0A1F5KQL6_9BACT|nr:MAG: aminoacyl-tRNA hydrolase [Candidatus Daviesbacteria bacterium RIFCSPHIGHO2_02_FULL_39_8]OGE43237.1 MAG: aminoacyl-tRNA hydrolase [Candidatus Daviesbacteria bacterium RIFCSPLOWO2_01_FULL_39_12]
MKLIVGLGNPGEKYASVRHNLGFMAVEEFRRKGDWGNWGIEGKFKSEIIKKDQIILARPQTYMNNSGMAVSALVNFYKIAPEDVIVVYDELDLPLGKIKVRLGGAAAGHHGVESIIKELGTDQFIRIRLGIGNIRTQSSEHKGAHVSAEKFVLEPFMHSEKAQVKHMIKRAVKALEIILEKGIEKAQNQFN